jgi:flagellar hook assembly protein FlgD
VEEVAGAASLTLRAIPNPSTGQVLIEYDHSRSTSVAVEVINAAGSLVRRLTGGQRSPGSHEVIWDGRDGEGRDLPTGVYFARIVMAEGTTAQRLVVAR